MSRLLKEEIYLNYILPTAKILEVKRHRHLFFYMLPKINRSIIQGALLSRPSPAQQRIYRVTLAA